MKILIGFAVISLSLIASIVHLQQTFASYYDFVGFAMVLGGTLAVSVMTVPVNSWGMLKRTIKYLFASPLRHRKRVLVDSVSLVQAAQVESRVPELDSPGLAGDVLKEGAELINLSIKVDSIEAILSERIFQEKERGSSVARSVRSLAKYPPAFGLAGTVLGLVHLMRGISEGMDPTETGVRMAIALVATFYGLLVANVLVNPVGEVIQRSVDEEASLAELALQSVVLGAEKTNTLEAQEMLNSHVPLNERVDVIGIAHREVA